MLATLIRRTADTSPFTRLQALKTLATVTLPLSLHQKATNAALHRLQDKSVMVRRGALAVVRSVVESNPFGGNLERDGYARKRDECRAWLEENQPESDKAVKDFARLQREEEEREGEEVTEEETERRRQVLEAAIARVESATQDEQVSVCGSSTPLVVAVSRLLGR